MVFLPYPFVNKATKKGESNISGIFFKFIIFYPHAKTLFFLISAFRRKVGREEGKDKGEREVLSERETSVGCLSYVPGLGWHMPGPEIRPKI